MCSEETVCMIETFTDSWGASSCHTTHYIRSLLEFQAGFCYKVLSIKHMTPTDSTQGGLEGLAPPFINCPCARKGNAP